MKQSSGKVKGVIDIEGEITVVDRATTLEHLCIRLLLENKEIKAKKDVKKISEVMRYNLSNEEGSAVNIFWLDSFNRKRFFTVGSIY